MPKLILKSRHRLLCGDSTNPEHVARLMGGAQADLCFTSPPYNVGALGWAGKSKYKDDADKKSVPAYVEFLNAFTQVALDVCGYAVINIQQVSGNKIAFVDWLYRWREHIADMAIWDKGTAEPAMEPGVLSSAFEYIVILSSSINPTRKIGLASWRGTIQNVHRAGKRAGNENASEHRATFPLHLPEYGLKIFDKATSVYEPFAGSGTTIIAAEQLQRRSFGMEIAPQYCDIILRRFENLTGEKPVLSPSAPSPAPRPQTPAATSR